MAQRILRPLGFADMLDETFDLYKKNFLLFVGITTVLNLPLEVVSHSLGLSESFLVILFGLLVSSFEAAAATWAVSQTYLGTTVTIIDSYRSIKGRTVALFFTVFVTYLIMIMGFILLVIPGVIFTIRYAFIANVFVVEGKTGNAARGRSRELASGHGGRIFLFTLVLVIVTILFSEMAAYSVNALFSVDAEREGGFTGLLLGLLVGIGDCLISPVFYIAFVLLYYDIRVRKEAFDLELLATDMKKAKIPEPLLGTSTDTQN